MSKGFNNLEIKLDIETFISDLYCVIMMFTLLSINLNSMPDYFNIITHKF